jgi:hypothetical protein
MSLTQITTVHCDDCADWEHTENDHGPQAVRAAALDRKRRGWITIGRGRERRDYCPRCVGRHETSPTMVAQ